MSGKLVNDINRETIDKLLSMLWLTLLPLLQEAQAEDDAYISLHKLQIVFFPKCYHLILFTFMSTVYVKIFLEAGGEATH